MSNAVMSINKMSTTNTMTSKEIAELTNKLHSHVMRDIRTLIEEGAVSNNLNESRFGSVQIVSYKDAKGEEREMYELDFTATMTLVTGYDANRRALVIKRWISLETGESLPAYQSGINPIIADHVEATLKVAKLFGLEGNQALLSTNRAVKEVTGVDCMALLDIKGLVKENKIQYFTPSILGKKIGISGIKFNQMLRDAGLQAEERDSRNNLIWNVTDKGKPYCEMVDTGKKHNGGSPVLQIKWAESVIEHCPMN